MELVSEFPKDNPELTRSQMIQAIFSSISDFELKGNELCINLTNFSMQEAAMQKIHTEFLGYLKLHSGNRDLTIRYVRIENPEEQRSATHHEVGAMTDQEQLEYMAKNNPVLKELVDQLKLDLKY